MAVVHLDLSGGRRTAAAVAWQRLAPSSNHSLADRSRVASVQLNYLSAVPLKEDPATQTSKRSAPKFTTRKQYKSSPRPRVAVARQRSVLAAPKIFVMASWQVCTNICFLFFIVAGKSGGRSFAVQFLELEVRN